MAAASEIIIKYELRPCIVYRVKRRYKAFFHKFIDRAKGTFALVELENGLIIEVEPSRIRFIDTAGKMKEIAFE